MAAVRLDLGARSYEIIIRSGLLADSGKEIAGVCRGRTALVVTDQTVGALYLKAAMDTLHRSGFQAFDAQIPAGEQYKTLESVRTLYERMIDVRIDRTGIVVTLGGGVIGDMGGFAAATYLRGIDFVQVPTTLLAQVDASVGGKVGVDLPRGKNLVGAFYQPKRVLIDPDVLATLPRRDFLSGLAELIKHGIITDRELFEFVRSNTTGLDRLDRGILEWAIARSCEIKAGVVTQDERESGVRAILNYGHTVGHGIEAATGFTKYTHGEAVSIGMVTAALVSEMTGAAEKGIAGEIAETLSAIGLPVALDADTDPDDVVRAMEYDKKVQFGKLRFILLKRIGEVAVTDTVTDADVRSALGEQARLFGGRS